MLSTRISLQYLLVLIITLPYSSAQQPCSSLTFSSEMSTSFFEELEGGCTIEPEDYFTLEIPLSGPQLLAQIKLSLINHKDNVFLDSELDSRMNNHILKFDDQGKYRKYTIPTSTSMLSLTIEEGTYSIFFDDGSITLSGNYDNTSPYILKVHLFHQDSYTNSLRTRKPLSSRGLSECSEGYFIVEGSCMKVCPAKQFDNNGVCTKCSDKCHTGHCISENLCNPCMAREIYSKEQNTCVEKCPTGFFEDYNNKICVKCADGCTTCSFPNGLCSASYFKTDMIINLIVSMSLLSLITLCACCCNKEKPDPTKNKEQNDEQKQSTEDSQPKNKENPEGIKKVPGGNRQEAYLILPEDIGFDDNNSDKPAERREKKRLTQFAESKLLTLSVQKKEFMIDDADEEKAISHGSASKLNPRTGSLSSLASTPLMKRRDSKTGPHSALGILTNKQRSQGDRSQGELASPYSASSGLMAKKHTSLGLSTKIKDSADGMLHLDMTDDREDSRPTVELSQIERGPKTVMEVEEILEEEMGKKEGYSGDSSFSISKDKETFTDLHACTICTLNKRDCLNKPCGHIVGCYACMEQFKESYGVCPRCKYVLKKIAKIK